MKDKLQDLSHQETRLACELMHLQDKIFCLKMYPWLVSIVCLIICTVGFFLLPNFWLVIYRLIFVIPVAILVFALHVRSKLNEHAQQCHRVLINTAYWQVMEKMERLYPDQFTSLKEFVNERRKTNM